MVSSLWSWSFSETLPYLYTYISFPTDKNVIPRAERFGGPLALALTFAP